MSAATVTERKARPGAREGQRLCEAHYLPEEKLAIPFPEILNHLEKCGDPAVMLVANWCDRGHYTQILKCEYHGEEPAEDQCCGTCFLGSGENVPMHAEVIDRWG